MTVPPCDHCRQPWAHGLDGPPVKRGTGKVIVLAILGGVAAQILFIVAAALVLAWLTPPTIIGGIPHSAVAMRPLPTGSLRPRLQACELFHKWQRTHDASLLKQAVVDAQSPRVPLSPAFPWPTKAQFRTDFSGLLRSTQGARFARSRMAISFEHRVQADCAPDVASRHQ